LVDAGNLYVNRHITGAIVGRQPFGGWKRSVVGPGAKAGGPNYVASLGTWQATFEGEPAAFGAAVARVWDNELAPSDPSGLAAEANVLRYRPLRRVILRAGPAVPERDLQLALAAARASHVEVSVSSPHPLLGVGEVVVEDDDTLAGRLGIAVARREADKIRFLDPPANEVRLAAHDAGCWVDDVPVVAHPAIEALRWAREQAVSVTLHRHGNVVPRSDQVSALAIRPNSTRLVSAADQ
jgi:RHH-type proline utilization regulon transcriptional repressor/proline dehydrogenase/delta 1-pyrroline-5-carboxylate dehydrogenase